MRDSLLVVGVPKAMSHWLSLDELPCLWYLAISLVVVAVMDYLIREVGRPVCLRVCARCRAMLESRC